MHPLAHAFQSPNNQTPIHSRFVDMVMNNHVQTKSYAISDDQVMFTLDDGSQAYEVCFELFISVLSRAF